MERSASEKYPNAIPTKKIYTSSTPVNTKSLMAFIFGQMGKLDRDEISPNKAVAMSKLASQAKQLLDYELKRTMVQIQLERMGHAIEGKEPRIREIESKVFDDTI